MKTTFTRKRPKSPYIELIQEFTPWVLISKTAEESGLTELQTLAQKASHLEASIYYNGV